MVYDAADGYEVYFGGESNGSFVSSTWIFSNGTWSNVSASAGAPPSPRSGMGITYDAADGYVLAVGGNSNVDGCGGPASSNCNDTWAFSEGKWKELTPAYRPVCLLIDSFPYCTPFPGGSNPIAYDVAEGSVVFFAGEANSPGFATETWTYHADIWTQVNTTAGAPPSNQDESIAYDNASEQTILFGGTLPGQGGWVSYNATWAFSDGNWTNLSSSFPLTPAARSSFGFTYDSASASLVLFGGAWSRCVDFGADQDCRKGIGGLESDTWTLNASGWTNVTASREPLPRWDPAFADDPNVGGPLLFGGSYNSSTVRASLGDTWIWSTATTTWTPINLPQNLAPPVISASPNPAVFGRPVQFNATESGGALPYTYAWAFGDGGTGGNISSITHAYTTNGPFLVVLTVSDGITGQQARGYLNVTILLQAQIQTSTLSVGPPNSFHFVGSAVGGTPPYEFSWNFGDGSPAVSVGVTNHTFNQSGTYSVTLTVTDAKGHQVTSQIQLNAGSSPHGFLGLPGIDGYYLIGGGLAAVLAAALVVTGSTRGAESGRPPAESDSEFMTPELDDETPVKILAPGEHDPAEDLV